MFFDKDERMKEKDIEVLLVCSVRYAIGRRTYIVGEVCDIVRSQKHLSEKCLNNIIKTIERAKAEEKILYIHKPHKTLLKPLGDDCDKQDWLDLLEWCKNELAKRVTYL